MNHLSALRERSRVLAHQFDTATRDRNDDLMGHIAFQQMSLDDQIARIERKLNRTKERQKRWG